MPPLGSNLGLVTDDPGYDFCLRFFGELRAAGVTDAVISPGSRSTPLALSARAVGMRVTVQLDERVAAFHALGQGRATGVASVLICTSGTAGANYLPAVIEANHSEVPMIVCTADRPPELRQWGAGQTIDQVHLYGTNVRWFHEVPVSGDVGSEHARSLALRAVSVAAHDRGPVHLNWPFREPLEPLAELQPPTTTLDPPVSRVSEPSRQLHELAVRHSCGLLVVGPADLGPGPANEILEFALRHGWPVVADSASGLRSHGHGSRTALITTGELLFASDAFTASLPRCEIVVRVGPAPTSKAYRLWLERERPPTLVLVAPSVDWADPTGSVTHVVPGPLAGVFSTDDAPRAEPRRTEWTEQWEEAEAIAARAAAGVLDLASPDPSELTWTASLVEHVAAEGPANLVVSNSMPVRDVDVAMRKAPDLRVIANRGANGIDGVIATAAGVAQTTEIPTWVLVGDIAAVHDLGGLAAVARLGLTNLTVFVIDNDEGGIFSFLPVAKVVDADAFTQLFATHHGTDITAVGAALGFDVFEPAVPEDLADLKPAVDAPRLVLVRTTAARTLAHMAALKAAVDEACSEADT